MNGLLGGFSLADFLLLHAAPIEGHGLEDLGVQAIGVGKAAATYGAAEAVRQNAGGYKIFP